MNTRESRNRYLTGLLVILLLSASGWAQESPPETAAEPTATPETVPLAYRSARATMDTFLSAFYLENGPDLQRAASCLDLSRLSPAVGRRTGLPARGARTVVKGPDPERGLGGTRQHPPGGAGGGAAL